MRKSHHIFFLLPTIAMVIVSVVGGTNIAKAYSYSGYRWEKTQVAFDVTDSSWPSAWSSTTANSAAAWNKAGSHFRLVVGYEGHKLYTKNLGSGINGVTKCSKNSSKKLTDCDTTLNTYYAWSTTGELGKRDVQNILTHEFGHWLQLNDLYNSSSDYWKTMYGYAGAGETYKRTLHQDDINGINYIY